MRAEMPGPLAQDEGGGVPGRAQAADRPEAADRPGVPDRPEAADRVTAG